MQQFSFALAIIAATASAAIVEDGLWTGNDWYDSETNIGVKNGIPYSDDPAVQRRITAPLSVDGPVDESYLEFTNVQRVMDILSEEDWEFAFAYANEVYTYDSFLKAVAKFPAFCNESNIED